MTHFTVVVLGRYLRQLGQAEEPVTWTHVVDALNAAMPAGAPWAVDETGAYELSTYHPESKWDSWAVGRDPELGHFRHHEWQVLLGHDEAWDRARAVAVDCHI